MLKIWVSKEARQEVVENAVENLEERRVKKENLVEKENLVGKEAVAENLAENLENE